MKNVVLTAVTILTIFVIATVSSCKQEPCKYVSCANASICKEGKCICSVGYEGLQCETETRAKFKGIWNVNEDGTLSSAGQYAMSIETGDRVNEVKINNFQNIFTTPLTAVCYKDTLILPLTTINGYTVEGRGFIVDTDPLNQHYYQHAVMTVIYKVTLPNGTINEFGTNGAGPSIWAK
jgi:hypothetical protein